MEWNAVHKNDYKNTFDQCPLTALPVGRLSVNVAENYASQDPYSGAQPVSVSITAPWAWSTNGTWAYVGLAQFGCNSSSALLSAAFMSPFGDGLWAAGDLSAKGNSYRYMNGGF